MTKPQPPELGSLTYAACMLQSTASSRPGKVTAPSNPAHSVSLGMRAPPQLEGKTLQFGACSSKVLTFPQLPRLGVQVGWLRADGLQVGVPVEAPGQDPHDPREQDRSPHASHHTCQAPWIGSIYVSGSRVWGLGLGAWGCKSSATIQPSLGPRRCGLDRCTTSLYHRAIRRLQPRDWGSPRRLSAFERRKF